MCQVGDTSNPSLSGATLGSNSHSNVASSPSVVGDACSTKKLRFNKHRLSVGDNLVTLSSRLGAVARKHVLVSYTIWTYIDALYNNKFGQCSWYTIFSLWKVL